MEIRRAPVKEPGAVKNRRADPAAMICCVHDRDVFVLDDSTTLVHLLSHFVKHAPFSCAKWVEDLLCWEATEWKPSKNRAEVQNSCRLSGAIWANTASKRRLTTV